MNVVKASSEADWQRLVDKGNAVFDLSKRLPDVVNRLRCGPEPFFDGDVVFGPRSWPLVASLAGLHGEAVVHFLTVAPAPRYYVRSTGQYGGFTVPVADSPDAYREGLFGGTKEVPSRDLGYTADVVALFGDSGRWGIWSERDVAGLVVADDAPGLAGWALEHGPFLSAFEALHDFLAVHLGVGPEAESFAAELLRNYDPFGIE